MRSNVGVMRGKSKRKYAKRTMTRDEFRQLNYEIDKLNKQIRKLKEKKSKVRYLA